jgi:outer membrane lipoprotein-sorting protein
MNPENKNLDELITGAIGRDKPQFDFDKWQIKHKKEIENFKSQTTGQKTQPTRIYMIGKLIMRSKVSKLTAAAAVIFIAAASMFFLDKSVAPVYGITDMPELFEQAKVIHIQGMQYFGSHRMPDGSEIPPVPIENWIDLENGRSRSTQTGLSSNPNYVSINISESISDGQYMMSLNHTERYVTFFKKSDYQQMLDTYNSSQMTQQQIFEDIEQLQNFELTGSEQIDGVTYDIWEGQIKGPIPIWVHKYKYWVLPATGQLGRVQLLSKINNGQWDLEFDYSKIEYNVEIPDDVFSMDIPEGYELKNTKETAFTIEPGTGGGGLSDDRYSIRANVILGFRMPDDSIIAGWFSVDDNSEIPQEDFFTDLEFGGSLPALPMEIYGLRAPVMNSDIIYTGYHLTYTQKDGKFFEWSLYVPNDTPPQNIKNLFFNAMSRFNLDPEPKGNLGLGLVCNMSIENANDFDTWVLGAMSEFSDDGLLPENITYQNVTELSQQIHEEIKQ